MVYMVVLIDNAVLEIEIRGTFPTQYPYKPVLMHVCWARLRWEEADTETFNYLIKTPFCDQLTSKLDILIKTKKGLFTDLKIWECMDLVLVNIYIQVVMYFTSLTLIPLSASIPLQNVHSVRRYQDTVISRTLVLLGLKNDTPEQERNYFSLDLSIENNVYFG